MQDLNTQHTAMQGLPGACCQAGRWFHLGFLPLLNLPLNKVQSPKGKWPDGQRHCPVRQAAKEAVSSPTGLPFSLGELWIHGAPAQARPTPEHSQPPPFARLKASCIPLSILKLGTKQQNMLENTIKNFCQIISQRQALSYEQDYCYI